MKWPNFNQQGAYIQGELIYNGTKVERIIEEAHLGGIRVYLKSIRLDTLWSLGTHFPVGI